MGILTRYILRAHVAPFFFALAVLTGILMINTVARRLETMAGKGLPWSVMAEVFVLSLPHILALTLPMSVLVATLFAFSRLAADNEITALKASGVNLNRLLLPLMVIAAIFAGGMVWFNDYLLPETNHILKIRLLDIQRKTPTLQLEEQTINPIRTGRSSRPQYYLQAAEVRGATNELLDIVIWDFSERGQNRTIYADSGMMAFNETQTDLFLTLHDGWINQIEAATPERFIRSFFDQYRIQIRGVGNELSRTEETEGHRTDREMSLAMLKEAAEDARARSDSLRQEAVAVATGTLDLILTGPAVADADRLPAPGDRPGRPIEFDAGYPAGQDSIYDDMVRQTSIELNTLAGRVRSLDRRANVHMVEYHKKYAISWAVIVFVLLGAPLAVRFPRGGVGLVIAASIGIFAVYYAGLIGGENVADERNVSPLLAMWAPNILFFFIALWGLSRIGKEAATNRGGGWDDMWESIKGMARRPMALVRSGDR
ncbi:MAG: LptF/LptG family permease [Gemmatimonadota bacterium]